MGDWGFTHIWSQPHQCDIVDNSAWRCRIAATAYTLIIEWHLLGNTRTCLNGSAETAGMHSASLPILFHAILGRESRVFSWVIPSSRVRVCLYSAGGHCAHRAWPTFSSQKVHSQCLFFPLHTLSQTSASLAYPYEYIKMALKFMLIARHELLLLF